MCINTVAMGIPLLGSVPVVQYNIARYIIIDAEDMVRCDNYGAESPERATSNARASTNGWITPSLILFSASLSDYSGVF